MITDGVTQWNTAVRNPVELYSSVGYLLAMTQSGLS